MTTPANDAVMVAANQHAGAGSNTEKARPESGKVIERMIDMMMVIPRAPHWISTAQVHERLATMGYVVDRRTVVRDLNKLSERFGFERRGDPAEDGKRTALAYAWRWPEKSSGFGAPVLTETEALTLVMVREHLADLLPPMVIEALTPQFARAEAKLRNTPSVAGGGLKHWNASVHVVQPTQPLGRPHVRASVRDAIYMAMATRSKFTGWYRRRTDVEPQEWTFNPLGLVIRGQVTYIVATLWDYDDVRLYPLHRFERAQKEDARRREPAGFDMDAYLAEQNGLGFATGRGEITLKLRFHNNAGAHLLETPLADNQVVVDVGDGVLDVAATVPETGQLIWWLLGFGDGVEVVGPADLRERMKMTVQGMVGRYAAGQS